MLALIKLGRLVICSVEFGEVVGFVRGVMLSFCLPLDSYAFVPP